MVREMSNILFLCPTHRDYREIDALGLRRRHNFFFHDYASIRLEELVADEPPEAADVDDVRNEIAGLIERYSGVGIDAVVSSDDYPGAALASILAQRFGLPGVAPAVNLRCQHKYYSRLDQRRFAPEAVPAFHLLDENHLPALQELSYPVFLKPVKSFFSVGAYRANSMSELIRRGWQSSLQESFFRPFETALHEYAHLGLGPRVIVEELLQGLQVTVEGYVACGDVHVIGVVDSLMYPGTRSFQRFEYPSALPACVQRRMAEIARKVIAGIGYDNGLFNIEMMYNPERDVIHIIEINPRMASQFADLYEKVDGTNTYDVLFDIALGNKPTFGQRQGRYRFAASCVLRTFENALVTGLPSAQEIEQVRKRYPDVRVEVLATQGRRLSQEMQDGESFRYGIVSIGGRDRDDILHTLDECRARLSFTFETAIDAPAIPARKMAQGRR
jgi:biotin carboxylase